GGSCPPVHQQPRYVAVRKNKPVSFICHSPEAGDMQWYRTAEGSAELCGLERSTASYSIARSNSSVSLTLARATYRDSGIYVCDRKGLRSKDRLHSCGTELRVMGTSSTKQVQSRNTLKDAIIIIQSILLVVFISIPVLLFLDKVTSRRLSPSLSLLQGLEVEQMATYEDITPFRDVKAKWTVGEHPGEE
ncbi:CD79B protein, partial [Malurus elegans]|nr:CD79B protein [Malurus elegans]